MNGVATRFDLMETKTLYTAFDAWYIGETGAWPQWTAKYSSEVRETYDSNKQVADENKSVVVFCAISLSTTYLSIRFVFRVGDGKRAMVNRSSAPWSVLHRGHVFILVCPCVLDAAQYAASGPQPSTPRCLFIWQVYNNTETTRSVGSAVKNCTRTRTRTVLCFGDDDCCCLDCALCGYGPWPIGPSSYT